MPANQRRDRHNPAQSTEDTVSADEVMAAQDAEGGDALQPANADESRAVGDPGPDWATGEAVPEVMSARDQRRAGVIEQMRRNSTSTVDTSRPDGQSAVMVVGPATSWLDTNLRDAMRTMDGSASGAVEDIVAAVMNADNVVDILAESTLLDAEDILGVPLQIWGYKVNESEFQQGMPGYMVINAIRIDTKADATFTTGAYKVQAQMLRLGQLQKFPVNAKVVKAAKPTKGGFYPLQLVVA